MTGDRVITKVELDLPKGLLAEGEASNAAMKIAEYIQMSPDRIDEVGGAVTEVCLNAISFTPISHSEKLFVTIEVLGGRDPEKLRITVQNTSPVGGFCLRIIRALMDEVEIHSILGEGTTVVMSRMR